MLQSMQLNIKLEAGMKTNGAALNRRTITATVTSKSQCPTEDQFTAVYSTISLILVSKNSLCVVCVCVCIQEEMKI